MARLLVPGRQALLVLAHLWRDTYAHLASGVDLGIATAYRYMREAVGHPAAVASSRAGFIRPSS